MENKHDIALDFSRQVKRILGNKLSKVILYGSYARGDYNLNSNMDIMVLTTLLDKEIEKTEYAATEILSREVERRLAILKQLREKKWL